MEISHSDISFSSNVDLAALKGIVCTGAASPKQLIAHIDRGGANPPTMRTLQNLAQLAYIQVDTRRPFSNSDIGFPIAQCDYRYKTICAGWIFKYEDRGLKVV